MLQRPTLRRSSGRSVFKKIKRKNSPFSRGILDSSDENNKKDKKREQFTREVHCLGRTCSAKNSRGVSSQDLYALKVHGQIDEKQAKAQERQSAWGTRLVHKRTTTRRNKTRVCWRKTD